MLVLVVAASVGCGDAQDDRPDIVLIVIDTLRADHLPSYGYDKPVAPFLAELASRGVVCERAHATSSWTAPSTASLHSSLNPLQHGVLQGILADLQQARHEQVPVLNRVPESVSMLAEVLRDAGYATFAVTDNPNICREMGFAQGFDHFRNFMYDGAPAVNAAVTTWAPALEAAEPSFLYLHYMDPHEPYHRREPYFQPGGDRREVMVNAYDSEIRWLDDHIRELNDRLGWDENTLIVITSDHGEEFLDHGAFDHGRTLFHEVLDVPLIFVLPDGRNAGGRVNERVTLLDVLPTLRELVGLPPDSRNQGLGLAALLRGEADALPKRNLFAHLVQPPWFGSLTLRSVIDGDLKLVITDPNAVQLFDLVEDSAERRNLAAHREDDVRRLWETLHGAEAGWPRFDQEGAGTAVEDIDLEKLRALGYVR
jgi:arylsulfatase A-like enzyme